MNREPALRLLMVYHVISLSTRMVSSTAVQNITSGIIIRLWVGVSEMSFTFKDHYEYKLLFSQFILMLTFIMEMGIDSGDWKNLSQCNISAFNTTPPPFVSGTAWQKKIYRSHLKCAMEMTRLQKFCANWDCALKCAGLCCYSQRRKKIAQNVASDQHNHGKFPSHEPKRQVFIVIQQKSEVWHKYNVLHCSFCWFV